MNSQVKPWIFITSGKQIQSNTDNLPSSIQKSDDPKSEANPFVSSLKKLLNMPVTDSALAVYLATQMMPFGNLLVPLALMMTAKLRSDNEDPSKINVDIKKSLENLAISESELLIDTFAFNKIPEGFEFPPGHPLPDKLYRIHPLKDKENKSRYIPSEMFDSLLYEERESELIKLLVDLGATKIVIKETSNVNAEGEITGGADLQGTGGIKANSEFNRNHAETESRTFILQGKKQLNIEDKNYEWLNYEPSWKALRHARQYGGCLQASIELTTDSSYSLAAGMQATEGLLQKFISFDAGISFNHQKIRNKIFSVEFRELD